MSNSQDQSVQAVGLSANIDPNYTHWNQMITDIRDEMMAEIEKLFNTVKDPQTLLMLLLVNVMPMKLESTQARLGLFGVQLNETSDITNDISSLQSTLVGADMSNPQMAYAQFQEARTKLIGDVNSDPVLSAQEKEQLLGPNLGQDGNLQGGYLSMFGTNAVPTQASFVELVNNINNMPDIQPTPPNGGNPPVEPNGNVGQEAATAFANSTQSVSSISAEVKTNMQYTDSTYEENRGIVQTILQNISDMINLTNSNIQSGTSG